MGVDAYNFTRDCRWGLNFIWDAGGEVISRKGQGPWVPGECLQWLWWIAEEGFARDVREDFQAAWRALVS